MSTVISAKIQSDASVYLYDEIGQYRGCRRAHSGKAINAVVNGSNLILQTDKGKTEVYRINGGNTTYAYSR